MAHIDTSAVVRASVWIMPTGSALETILKAARAARQRAGGPDFHPHLTLLKGIETTQEDAAWKLKRLASRIQPLTVRLGRIEWRQEYFRCLYVTVALTPELAAAQKAAHEVFEMNPPEPFEPHVSLLYGSLDEAAQKALAEALGGAVNAEFETHYIHLVNASQSVPVTEWRTLAESRLAVPVTQQ